MTRLLLSIPILLGMTMAAAQDQPSKEAIAAKLNNVEPGDIVDSPLPGLYEVSVGPTVAYVSKDGRYFVQGEVYDLETTENLTEKTRAAKRVGMLDAVPRDSMIVFSPEGETKHAITIFTDIDCGYCRQFHREIDQVNALGIEVRYLFYPRTGPDTESWAKAEKVWCADDRNAALTRAKLGGPIPDRSCAANPVESHYELGNRVGVRGTPSIYSADGEHLGGYLAPATLAQQLEAQAAR